MSWPGPPSHHRTDWLSAVRGARPAGASGRGTAQPLPSAAVRIATRTWKEIERLTRSNVGCRLRREAGCETQPVEVPDGRAPTAPRGNCADPLHRLGRCRALSALLHRSTRRQGGLSRRPGQYCASQQLDRHQCRRRTDDKPTVILETPRDPDRVSSFLNIRVKDIEAVYAEWSARGAQFLTPPKQHAKRCYIRDPDGHLIEVGQTTDPEGDWSPVHWPSSTPPEESG
jgi:hypothetical protein